MNPGSEAVEAADDIDGRSRANAPEAVPREVRPALERLITATYPSLLRIAGASLRTERRSHAMEPSALVHETYLRLRQQRRADWHDERHFFAIVKRVMNRVLVDQARRRSARKRGGGIRRVESDRLEELAGPEIGEASVSSVVGSLFRADPEAATVFALRTHVGLTMVEISSRSGISLRSVARRWKRALAWLSEELPR